MEICEHLKPILEHELLIGNSIKEVSRWPKAECVINLVNTMDIEYEKKCIQLADCVRYRGFNNTPHYNPDKGFFCDKCRHSIIGPL